MDGFPARIGRLAVPALLLLLALLAAGSLAWTVRPALADSDDLMRRAEEITLFVEGLDPYQDPDMTYPPSAPPIFTPLVAPFEGPTLRAVWLGLNYLTLGAFCWAVVRIWGPTWPTWLKLAVILAIVATKPVRGGIALGQFHLIPTTLMLLTLLAERSGRPVLGGLLLGIALAKPTMVLPFVLFLLVRRAWVAVGVAAAVQGGCWLLTAAWLRRSPVLLLREWLDVAKLQDAAGLIDLPSLLNRNWPGLLTSSTGLTLAIVLAAGGLFWRFRTRSDRGLVPIAGFAAAIFAYHRPYDMVLLVPTLAYLIGQAWEIRPANRVAIVPAVVFALALIWPNHPSVSGRFEHLYEPIFIPLCYLILGLLIVSVARENATAPTASLGDAGRGRLRTATDEAGAQFARASS